MVKILSFLMVVVFGMGLLSACAQPVSGQPGSPSPVIDPTETAVPTEPAAGGQLTVTLDDQGKTINLNVGQSFLLKLGEDYTWGDVVVGDQNVVSRVRNIAVVRGAQGIYDANAAGTTTLTTTGDPVCRQAQPACAAPSIQFAVTLVVKG
jgi:hypothetical protein